MTNSNGAGTYRADPLAINQPELDDLQERLARTRWPAGPVDQDWSRGVPRKALQQLTEHWRTGFDWRAIEAQLNRWDPISTVVDGQAFRLLHARSPEPNALPLVINHGYPSSVVEFLRVLGPLTDPAAHGGDHADAFHVVVPSLPGFGISPELTEHGWTTARMAGVFTNVVHGLGYERYGVQGGDVGAGLAQDMAVQDPAAVVGIHVNSDLLAAGAVLSFAGVRPDPADFDEADRPLVERMNAFVSDGLGYISLLGTRPATIGYALDDSPVGLLAWFAEKFEEWTDLGNDGPSRTVDPDILLANVTAYWLFHNGTASGNFLYDAQHAAPDWGAQPSAPRGWSVFGGGGSVVRQLMDPQHEMSFWTEHSEGGHFAALEAPELFVEDVRAFFRPLR